MGQSLLGHGAITYYEISRFKAEDYNFPELKEGEVDRCDFPDYLKGPGEACGVDDHQNGTGEDLTAMRGSHLLLHDYSCVVDNVGGVAETAIVQHPRRSRSLASSGRVSTVTISTLRSTPPDRSLFTGLFFTRMTE